MTSLTEPIKPQRSEGGTRRVVRSRAGQSGISVIWALALSGAEGETAGCLLMSRLPGTSFGEDGTVEGRTGTKKGSSV